jgi:hypothetical protein
MAGGSVVIGQILIAAASQALAVLGRSRDGRGSWSSSDCTGNRPCETLTDLV